MTRRLALLLALALVWAAACIPGSSTQTSPQPVPPLPPAVGATAIAPASAPAPASPPGSVAAVPVPATPRTAEGIIRSLPEPPQRNLVELARRFRGADVPPSDGALPAPRVVTDPVGTTRTFWVTDLVRYRQFQVQATLRGRGEKAVFWVANDITVSDSQVQQALRDFDTVVYGPTMERFAGEDLFAGSGGPVITILNANIPGVAGYYSESDAFPPAVNQYSNELTMFFMSVPAVQPGSRQYTAVLAHEFQHLMHAYMDRGEEVWLNEGLSEMAAELAGFGPSGFVNAFRQQPQTPLTRWASEPGQSAANYGAAYLFVRYLFERFDSVAPLSVLARDGLPGVLGVNRYLELVSPGLDWDRFFTDWLLANRLDLPDQGLGYRLANIQLPLRQTVRLGESVSGTTNQMAGAYYGLPRETREIVFEGTPSVGLIDVPPRSGTQFWWSNRADGIDTTLRRTVDLRGVQQATLRYWTWFEIETSWDFGYVTVSPDGGRTWEILQPGRASGSNPLGLAYGPGYTGSSGGWVEDSVDLSRFAGREIILQFQYITDEGVNLSGWFLDDLSIPEIGWRDDAETAGDWESRGWARTVNALPQLYAVELVGIRGSVVERARLELDEAGRGVFDVSAFADRFDRLELVVGGLTPVTSQPAAFRLTVR